MPKIDLSDTVGLGLIISLNSGIIYSNQTGGTASLHSEKEGVYIPLRNDYAAENRTFQSPEVELAEYFEGPKYQGTGATNGIDKEDIDFITSVIQKYNLDSSVVICGEESRNSHESWVHVLITNDCDVFNGFGPYPRKAILTWANSD